MSVCCHETGLSIGMREELYCGTRTEALVFSAVGEATIGTIPEDLRRSQPCEIGFNTSIDIHRLKGGGSGHFIQLHTMECGEFLFSVSGETAEALQDIHGRMILRYADPRLW